MRTQKLIDAGDAAMVKPGEQIEFRAMQNSSVRLLLIRPRLAKQQLTVEPLVLIHSLEDASDRNATLLIAASDCRFQDVRNGGDESEWIPGEPEVITMKSGTVRWIRPGIHHFKNLGSTTARLVSIEW